MTETSNEYVLKSSFDATAKERAEMLPDEIVPINLDVPGSVATVYGALPRLRMLREKVTGTLGDFDLASFDKIESFANALAYAHFVFQSAAQPTEQLPALTTRAMEIRDLFLADAQALAKRGLVDAKRLSELKGGTGYLNLVSDIGTLDAMFRDRWSEIVGKTAISQEELVEAEQLTERIIRAYGERSQESTKVTAASDDRQRAFTLLVNAYDQARRAASYVRWSEGDVDKWVPSLWQGRGGRGEKKVVTPEPAPTPSPVATPSTPEPSAPTASPGLPGGSPFVQN